MTLSHRRIIIKRIVLILLICLIISTFFFILKKNFLFKDAYFHIGRIKEIRYAFSHFELINLADCKI